MARNWHICTLLLDETEFFFLHPLLLTDTDEASLKSQMKTRSIILCLLQRLALNLRKTIHANSFDKELLPDLSLLLFDLMVIAAQHLGFSPRSPGFDSRHSQ